jgi:hypothetical protein
MKLFHFDLPLVEKILTPPSNLDIQGETVKKSINFYLAKMNRFLIWPTLVLFIVYVLSGYGITNSRVISELTGGALTHSLSLSIHTTIAMPVLFLVSIHVLIGLRSGLRRLGIQDGRLLNIFLILLGVLSTTLIILMQFLRY